MTKHLKTRGELILSIIASYSSANGYSPSIREIMARSGLRSTSSTLAWVHRLIDEGRLRGDPATARTLRVIAQVPVGICSRPGCGNESDGRWCSKTCGAMAGHVRSWLRAAGRAALVDELGL